MSADLHPILARIATGDSLSEADAAAAFEILMSGTATPVQIGAFLMGLRVRGETVAEITGAVRAMRAKAVPAAAPEDAIDIVGTGGDGAGTYNISTAAALVVAGCGVPVAKHGNRSVSSKSGAADVLSCLGIDVDSPLEQVEAAIREAKIGFLMAPRHHPAMRHVGPARAELAVRTIFNLLGPMANPAGVKRQFTGVYDRRWLEPMAECLKNLGTEACWIVHGSDGLDELTTTGPSYVAELKSGTIRTFEVSPEEAGLARASMADLKGGTPDENAQALKDVLAGTPGAYRDVVVFNAGAALLVAGRAESLKDGAALAARSIDDGHAQAALERLVSLTGHGAASAAIDGKTGESAA